MTVISNNISRVPYYDVSSSYFPSSVFPQRNPHGIIHLQEHGNKVQESNIRTNPSGHDFIGNNLACDGIPHDDSYPTVMQNMEDGTMSHCIIPPSDTNYLRHGISNDISQVLNHNFKSSYSPSSVSPQVNPRGIIHV